MSGSCGCGFLHLPGRGGPRCTNFRHEPADVWTACGDPACEGRCQVCDDVRKEDAALDEADARRKGEW